jgi:RHS repeat-associated protein
MTGGPRRAKYEWGSTARLLRPVRRARRYFSFALGSIFPERRGEPVARYHLDAWGDFRFASELDASRNRFAFTGHVFDRETKLYNAKARYFDPKLGRFLTQDAYRGKPDEPPSLHRYAYGHNRPAYYIDQDGNIVFIPVVIAVVKIAAWGAAAGAAYMAARQGVQIAEGSRPNFSMMEVAKAPGWAVAAPSGGGTGARHTAGRRGRERRERPRELRHIHFDIPAVVLFASKNRASRGRGDALRPHAGMGPTEGFRPGQCPVPRRGPRHDGRGPQRRGPPTSPSDEAGGVLRPTARRSALRGPPARFRGQPVSRRREGPRRPASAALPHAPDRDLVQRIATKTESTQRLGKGPDGPGQGREAQYAERS